jgi:hypothetical protein
MTAKPISIKGTGCKSGGCLGKRRLLKLIRAFLTAGVMESRLVSPIEEGTP